MSSKKNPSTSRLFILKLCAFVICIFCVVIYDSLPEQIVTLYPNETTTLSIFSDESIGGNSQVLWIDQANSKYQCTVPDTTLSQYCGASITWWYEDGPKTYDLRGFQRLILDITYQGSTPNLVVNLYNTLQPIEGIIETTVAKSMSASVRSQDFNSRVNVDFNDFRVADWWITQHNIPREFAHVELNEITSVGISPIAPFSHQADIIQINAIYVAGTYFSKESLYASLLLFWALLLSSEALFHYWTLRQRVKRDAAKLQSLSDISAKYKVKAETDKLTGLSNREGLAQTLMAIEQSDTKSSYALLLIDVDHFKGLNDQFGHDVGDLVLEELAQSINRSIRSTDIVCRWGGEEFVVLFRYTKLQDVYPFAEKIRLEIARSSFAGTLKLPIYVSIGAALMSVDDSFEKTFKLADQALYAAKRAGRNQTIMAPQRSGYNN
jgi:diguanylate cyclase (GGDEF)-like protein